MSYQPLLDVWLSVCDCEACVCLQGVSYYDEEITVDLYDESEWRSSGVNTELVYQSLIDRQLMTHTAVDEGIRDHCTTSCTTGVVDDIMCFHVLVMTVWCMVSVVSPCRQNTAEIPQTLMSDKDLLRVSYLQ